MTTTLGRPEEADVGASPCPLNPNDQLLKDPIDEKWIDTIDDRICRELVRQLQQQEKAVMTTNGQNRLANVRALESLQRTLERAARRVSTRDARRATKDASNEDDAVTALERSVSPELERAVAKSDSQKVDTE